MEIESLSTIDHVKSGILKGREALEQLATTGNYVFHGSGQKLEKLEPRQAHTVSSDSIKTPDGPPAVFATMNAAIAIFMAVYSANKKPEKRGGASFRQEGEGVKFKASPGMVDFKDQETTSFVYVFDKKTFNCFEASSTLRN